MQTFYWLFLNLGLSTVRQNFCRFFVPVVSAEIGVEIASVPLVVESERGRT